MKHIILLCLMLSSCKKEKQITRCDYLKYKQKVSIVGGFYFGQKGVVEQEKFCDSHECFGVIQLQDTKKVTIKCQYIESSPNNICFNFPHLPSCEVK